MIHLTLKEQSLILGGDYDEEKCKEIQKQAGEYRDKLNKGEEVDDCDWDAWADNYIEFCTKNN